MKNHKRTSHTMISHGPLLHHQESTVQNHDDDHRSSHPHRVGCRCEKRQRTMTKADETTSEKRDVAMPPPQPNLYDILDEDLVIRNTTIGFRCTKRLRPVASSREGRGRTTILDQIDGLIKEDSDDTFMTSLSYPRGIRINPYRRQSSGAVDVVLAEESFKYWKDEIEDPQPLFLMPSKQ